MDNKDRFKEVREELLKILDKNNFRYFCDKFNVELDAKFIDKYTEEQEIYELYGEITLDEIDNRIKKEVNSIVKSRDDEILKLEQESKDKDEKIKNLKTFTLLGDGNNLENNLKYILWNCFLVCVFIIMITLTFKIISW